MASDTPAPSNPPTRLARTARDRDTRPMEARIAKLEAGVEYLQREVAEVKADVREMRGELREIRADISVLRNDLNVGLQSTRDYTHNFTLRLFLMTWAGLIATAMGLAGLMARGFHWF